MIRARFLPALCLSVFLLPSRALAQAPLAPRDDSIDHVFGRTLADPYRWMEGQPNARFAEWLKAQGAAGRAWLVASPALERWRTRLAAVSTATRSNGGQHRVAGRIFFLRLEKGRQGVLMERLSSGEERTLLDPNALTDAGGHATVRNYAVSLDGKKIAVNVDRGGNEISSIEFYDADSGARLPDQIDHVWGEFQADWLPDGSGVVYTQMAPVPAGGDIMLDMRVRFHRLGSDTAADPVVVARGTDPSFPLTPQEFPAIEVGTASDWALAIAAGARAETRACLVKKADLLQATPPFNCLIAYDDAVQGADILGSTLYLLSVKGAPNGRLLALDLTSPQPKLADARVLVPEKAQEVLTGFAVARDAVYLKYMHDGIDRIVRLPHDGSAPRELALPYEGAAYRLDSDPRADGIAFTLQGWTQPPTFFGYDPQAGTLADLHLGNDAPRDYAATIRVVRTEARSADGTMVPLTLLVPRDLKPDGSALTLLMAYGAYGISLQPYFDPMTLEWVAAGHVAGVAGVRGGGEKGDAWRLAGKGPNKHKGVEDAVGAADYVARAGYSDARHIALVGESAGGLVAGGALARYPAHFGAVIIHAGVLNPSRLAHSPNGANQFAELGDPSTRDGFAALVAMDPYLALARRRYPPVLLDVGLNDNRVAPWNSGKLGAQLRHLSPGTPVVFRTDSDAGHFGTSFGQLAAQMADYYTFLEKVLATQLSAR